MSMVQSENKVLLTKKSSRKFTAPREGRIGSSNFTGEIEEMNGKVFNTEIARAPDYFEEALKALANYAGSWFKFWQEIAISIEELKLDIIEMPEIIPGTANAAVTDDQLKTFDPLALRLWDSETKEKQRKKMEIESGLGNLWSVVWRSTTPESKQSIMAHASYKKTKSGGNVIKLLKIVRELCFNFTDSKDHYQNMYDDCRYYNLYQSKDMAYQLFSDRYIPCCKTVETIGGTLGGENISVAREVAIVRTNIQSLLPRINNCFF